MKNTIKILNSFYTDCFRFWLIEGKSVKAALLLALDEVSEVTHNPFDPHGELLDADAKNEFINKIKSDLKELKI